MRFVFTAFEAAGKTQLMLERQTASCLSLDVRIFAPFWMTYFAGLVDNCFKLKVSSQNRESVETMLLGGSKIVKYYLGQEEGGIPSVNFVRMRRWWSPTERTGLLPNL